MHFLYVRQTDSTRVSIRSESQSSGRGIHTIKRLVSYNPATACSAVFFFFFAALFTLPAPVLEVFILLTLPLTLFFFFFIILSPPVLILAAFDRFTFTSFDSNKLFRFPSRLILS